MIIHCNNNPNGANSEQSTHVPAPPVFHSPVCLQLPQLLRSGAKQSTGHRSAAKHPNFSILFHAPLLHVHRRQRQDILRRPRAGGSSREYDALARTYSSLEIRPEVICDRSMVGT